MKTLKNLSHSDFNDGIARKSVTHLRAVGKNRYSGKNTLSQLVPSGCPARDKYSIPATGLPVITSGPKEWGLAI